MSAERPETSTFRPDCKDCPRLAAHLADVKVRFPEYFASPVPAFGSRRVRLLIVGLAPGLHGANRTGRPFTGDYAGVLLYATLHRYGYASRPASIACDDGLRLKQCRITNAVKCLPPQNKPETVEVSNCNRYLRAEIDELPAGSAILALGSIAHGAVLQACSLKRSSCKFAHCAEHPLPRGRRLFDSYHCSRYNTQTNRLSTAMFEAVFASIARYLDTA